MKNRQKSLLGLTVLALAVMVGCGGSPEPRTDPDDPRANWPEWFLQENTEDGVIVAQGTATSRDAQFAMDKASFAADGSLAEQVEARYENLTTQFREEIGTGADAQLLNKTTDAAQRAVKQALKKKAIRQQDVVSEDGVWRGFVVSTLPEVAAKLALLGAITEDEELYTRFRESQAFEKLEKELAEQFGG